MCLKLGVGRCNVNIINQSILLSILNIIFYDELMFALLAQIKLLL